MLSSIIVYPGGCKGDSSILMDVYNRGDGFSLQLLNLFGSALAIAEVASAAEAPLQQCLCSWAWEVVLIVRRWISTK